MEVKINREIRNYTESMFFGLSMRQFIWAWIRSELVEPKEIRFESSNFYYEALKDKIEKSQQGGKA